MQNNTIEEIQLSAHHLGDPQIIETLTSFAIKNTLEEHELEVRSCLNAILEERHGSSEFKHIESLIEKRIVA
ncbi:MAG: hypothetical protein ACJAZP_000615 [Psychromonas sp.]|jgi:hypothetical protein|uniref:hypothetical protein n=1 Tax=Psychromonas sp. TaxID=1884585 RepID=UPI0039E2AD2F